MDIDIGTVVYIILVILYFVFTAFKKKNAPDQPDERYEGQEAGEKRPASFEDMLRDIRREQNERVKDIEQAGQGEVSDYEYDEHREIVEENAYESWDKKSTPSEPIIETRNKYYDGAEGSLKNYDRKPLVKLDDQVDLASDEKILGEVEDVAEEYKGNTRYGKLLKNPESVRDAVILTEILNRKY
ncbi:MAG TPA: hypothetical protein VK921_06460 [Anditalea sp.]|nr:hypothetical protein [Anditalea sp.]